MTNDRRARLIALIGTVICAALLVVVLTCSYLSLSAQDKSENPKSEILLADEEFIEVMETQTYAQAQETNEGATYMEETVEDQSQPTPTSGTDLVDEGKVADAPDLVKQKEPSPVKQKVEEQPKKTGPAVDKQKQQQEESKRAINDEVANVFKNSSGKHNSLNSSNDNGNSGNSNVDKSQQGTVGQGTGSVGGGWIMPKYASVPSTVTGSVKMIVRIDNTGTVTSVEFNGGNPPAATNSALKKALEREVRSRKFSRSDYSDAQPATAYITYTFK